MQQAGLEQLEALTFIRLRVALLCFRTTGVSLAVSHSLVQARGLRAAVVLAPAGKATAVGQQSPESALYVGPCLNLKSPSMISSAAAALSFTSELFALHRGCAKCCFLDGDGDG